MTLSSESNKSASSTSSVVSETSTVIYDHETWEDFAPRVHQLCRQLWPSASEDENFVVEKLRGGSYNRIIGIQTPPSTGESANPHILRIPRFELAQQERELIILRYVRQRTAIPTAQIFFSDSTSENPLNEPYVIQTRIPGRDLQDTYPSLSHEHKLAVAEQWGRLLLSELAVQNDFAGVVDATTDKTGTHVYGFRPFEVKPEDDVQDMRLLSKQSILDFFTLQFERWKAADRRAYPNEFPLDHLDRLTVVVKEMDAAGLYNDAFFSLCHLDLAPRNVMIDIKGDGSLQISGVLDWDSAVFGPNFVVCEPPSWIWTWSNNDSEDEEGNEDFEDIHANDTPATPEAQELKRRFEEIIGEGMLKFFYLPQYRLARSLFHVAIDGLRSNDAFTRADRSIQQWEALQGKSIESPAIFDATALMQQVDIDEDLNKSDG